jgi:hypothetical protein
MNWIKIHDRPLSKNNTSGERVIVEKNSETMLPIFKGTTKLAAKLSQVAFVLVDINSKKNWPLTTLRALHKELNQSEGTHTNFI